MAFQFLLGRLAFGDVDSQTHDLARRAVGVAAVDDFRAFDPPPIAGAVLHAVAVHDPFAVGDLGVARDDFADVMAMIVGMHQRGEDGIPQFPDFSHRISQAALDPLVGEHVPVLGQVVDVEDPVRHLQQGFDEVVPFGQGGLAACRFRRILETFIHAITFSGDAVESEGTGERSDAPNSDASTVVRARTRLYHPSTASEDSSLLPCGRCGTSGGSRKFIPCIFNLSSLDCKVWNVRLLPISRNCWSFSRWLPFWGRVSAARPRC